MQNGLDSRVFRRQRHPQLGFGYQPGRRQIIFQVNGFLVHVSVLEIRLAKEPEHLRQGGAQALIWADICPSLPRVASWSAPRPWPPSPWAGCVYYKTLWSSERFCKSLGIAASVSASPWQQSPCRPKQGRTCPIYAAGGPPAAPCGGRHPACMPG